jgi:hypothetical protein
MADLVRFTECMSGWLAPLVNGPDPHEQGARRGRAAGVASCFVLTVVTPDVDAMVADPEHRSPAYGYAHLPALHLRPMRVADGHLDLFVDAAPDARILHMRYGLRLQDDDGRAWFLRGIKEVARRRWWPTTTSDTTTLFVDVWPGDAPVGAPSQRGVFTMGPGGVAAQGLSFRGEGAWAGMRGIVRYLGYYVRRVLRVYTGPRTEPLRGVSW